MARSVSLNLAHFVDCSDVSDRKFIDLREILMNLRLTQIWTASKTYLVFIVGFWRSHQHDFMVKKINIKTFFLESGRDSWLDAFWVHILFKFLFLLIILMQDSHVLSISCFGSFKLADVLLLDVLDFAWVSYVEIQLFGVESKSLHF